MVNNSKKIIFFIEDLSHFRFVEKLFDYFYLNEFDIKVLCFEIPFTNSKYDLSKLDLIVLKNDYEKINYLINLEGDLFFTTTPSIGATKFPKSKALPKDLRPIYIYLFHSLVSPNVMYEKNSFKYFDVIFSPSEIVTSQLRFLIGKSTKVFTTGYLLFDKKGLYKYKNEISNKIIVAPTWGDGYKSVISNIDSIKNFAEVQDLQIVFRPHPMSNIDLLKESDIEIDSNKNLTNLGNYKYLITDYSGIALEFFFLTGRPIIFLNVEKKIKSKLKGKEKKLSLIENEMRSIIGREYSFKDLLTTPVESITIDEENATQFIIRINHSSNVLYKKLQILSDYL